MIGGSEWAAEGIDLERPNPSRVDDYLLGGAHNLAIDREFAKQLLAVEPNARYYASVTRRFVRRAVAFLVEQGIRQILDIGSGIPALGSVHQIAHRLAPDTQVLYVDNDPITVHYCQTMLSGNERIGRGAP